jgi:histone acetyltransferase (RNA polymerase elongator complex component)
MPDSMRMVSIERWKLVHLVNQGVRMRILDTLVYELMYEIDTMKMESRAREESLRTELKAERGRTGAVVKMYDAQTSLTEAYRHQITRLKWEKRILILGIVTYGTIRILRSD